MHKSRLAGLIIDCQTENLDQAVEFWSQALGYAIKPSTAPEDQNYVPFATKPEDLHIEVQKVEHPSRVHIDIETDDIEAEVRRLEQLGAKRLRQVQTWWVMEAPTGHRFCVVRPQRANFAEEANQWQG
ncbi:VOC family protein [Leptolyngbya sp. FACHB-261]|uniref:VOC family protein n=1 Tax=Leptolyngbya sp. FACHB-261 TaxID=2692806 RepID=UPI0016894E23|nr:VOC family protein [Leptolyngbya sp. FACHB-261]MBD2099558.1 VOC family protein [Leptolyngbya sp. FACHB-261]